MIPMPRATSNGIEIEYETFGALAAPPLLLIAGLGSQMLSWDDDFCALLASRSFRVIRYDNRDSGLSTWVEDAYTLDDMADDAAGLLDALGIAAAHVVGASMGGFIAQLLTLDHRGRARLMEIEGMGHDVPRRVWSQVADAIASLAHEAPLVERA